MVEQTECLRGKQSITHTHTHIVFPAFSTLKSVSHCKTIEKRQ